MASERKVRKGAEGIGMEGEDRIGSERKVRLHAERCGEEGGSRQFSRMLKDVVKERV